MVEEKCSWSSLLQKVDISYYIDYRYPGYIIISCPLVTSSCTEGDVHLTGGNTVMEGRVEVCHNQTWCGLLAAPPPTGTTMIPLLCVDIYTTQQTVSCVIKMHK